MRCKIAINTESLLRKENPLSSKAIKLFNKILCKLLGHKLPKPTFEVIFCGFVCQRCERFIKSNVDRTQSLIPYKLWLTLMDKQ